MSDADFLVETFRRQLSRIVTPDVIRAIENGGSIATLWSELNDSGFMDAMLPEDAGGAGLTRSEAFPIVAAAGEYCVPLPFAETMMARAILVEQGLALPTDEAILIAGLSAVIPSGRFARYAIVDRDGKLALVSFVGGGTDLFRVGGAAQFEDETLIAELSGETETVLLTAAAIASALMTGAMARVLEMTLRHANERNQFGRALGKFQAIQQQLAVAAEQVLSAQVAARNAFTNSGFSLIRVAAAKCRANTAATTVCNIAHAIHGAIGVTEEFDLQLYTRRIKQWQLSYGSESYWGRRLGEARINSDVQTSADFLRLNLSMQEA